MTISPQGFRDQQVNQSTAPPSLLVLVFVRYPLWQLRNLPHGKELIRKEQVLQTPILGGEKARVSNQLQLAHPVTSSAAGD